MVLCLIQIVKPAHFQLQVREVVNTTKKGFTEKFFKKYIIRLTYACIALLTQ